MHKYILLLLLLFFFFIFLPRHHGKTGWSPGNMSFLNIFFFFVIGHYVDNQLFNEVAGGQIYSCDTMGK